jgi:hypothetical protein
VVPIPITALATATGAPTETLPKISPESNLIGSLLPVGLLHRELTYLKLFASKYKDTYYFKRDIDLFWQPAKILTHISILIIHQI